MGIEDYIKAFFELAKALAKAVMDNLDDTTKADEVRRKILLEMRQSVAP